MLPFTSTLAIGVRGRNISLNFSVTEDEPEVVPEFINWFLSNGEGMQEIISDGRFSFSEDKLALFITNLSLSDKGNYTLFATNIIGTGSAQVFLDVES